MAARGYSLADGGERTRVDVGGGGPGAKDELEFGG